MNRKRIKKEFANFGQRMLRMPRTRGFGVQSPTAYSFLRKVVNEKEFLRNYRQTHSEISSSYPQDAPRQKRLLFRIRTVYPNVAEMPSILPVKPSFSVVVALMDIWSSSTPITSARQAFMAGTCGLSLGRSAQTVASILPSV